MSEDEAIDVLQNCIADYVIGEYCEKCEDRLVCADKNEDCYFQQAIDTILDLYQQKCKQNKDAKDYIEYYLLDNMSIEGNAENTHKELKKIYNMLGGDNLR